MSSPYRRYLWPALSILLGAFVLLTTMPSSWKSWAPVFLQPTLHLGLDLQGGTQLDFRISETEMEKQVEQLQADIAELERTNAEASLIADKRAQIANIAAQRANIVESIRTVLERRVNSLGVSEAVITPSFYGSEKHLLVECPGVVDIQKCIATVGKTILLEFKEQASGEDAAQIVKMRELAAQSYARITASGETLKTIGEDIGTTLGVSYQDEGNLFQDQLPKGAADLWRRKAGDAVLLREVELDPVQRDNGTMTPRGILLAEVTGKKESVDRPIEKPEEAIAFLAESRKDLTLVKHKNASFDTLDEGYRNALKDLQTRVLAKGIRKDGKKSILYVQDRSDPKEEISVSHILIAYQGAARAEAGVTRTKDRALERAREVAKKLKQGENFALLAGKESDGPSAKEEGSLGTIARGTMPPAFDQAAFALKKVGDISEVVETEFGFHIIRLDAPLKSVKGSLTFLELLIAPPTHTTVSPPRPGSRSSTGSGQTEQSGSDIEKTQTELLDILQKRAVTRKEDHLPIRSLFFSFLPTGWKDTTLDGKHFQRATTTTDSLTGTPLVQIVFDGEGGKLFFDLTKRNVGKPIAIFVGGELISAPTVQAAIAGGTAVITGSRTLEEANRLAQDLNTGAIPAPVHLVGQVTVEPTLGQAALEQSLKAAFWGLLLVGIYMIFYYRILGVIATLALIAYALIFVAILKLPLLLFTGQYVVLSLAGIAGIILSVGMAVDANVLIFERMKEELAKGKLLSTAADTGFKRAWSSIRDSNLSTLLTAAILFIIGTSIVRGFAVTLSIGILLSMFTAIVLSRFMISLLYKSPIAENLAAFGVKKASPPH